METKEIQTELLQKFAECKALKKQLDNCYNNMTTICKNLLLELKKIPNWETMIKHCRDHYSRFPDEFFNWCQIEFNLNDNSIYFVKGYSDGEEYIVLTINLNETLEDQVNKANKDLLEQEQEKARIEKQKELEELKRLKEKYPNH